MRLYQKLGQAYRQLARSVVESAEDAEPKLVLFGVFCLAGFPLYYTIWAFVFPQPYESPALRAVGMCICLPAVFIRKWPKAAHRFVAAYWYFSILFSAPFFFTFMLLHNGVNTVWSMSLLIAIVLVVLVFDLLNAIILLTTGSAAALSLFALTAQAPVPWSKLVEQLPIYIFAVFGVSLFNQALARETRAKIAAAMALGGHIAHELRTPLAGIRAAAELIGMELPASLGVSTPPVAGTYARSIGEEDIQLLREAPETIAREVDHAFLVIDLALTNTGIRPLGAHEPRSLDIIAAVRSAVARYPFKDPRQRAWISIDATSTFSIRIIPLLFDHIIFNLLKNAVYAIQAAGRSEAGQIRIHAKPGRHVNRLHVEDNGIGIPPAVIGRVFSPFFSTRANGTGLGLHFCRTVMNRFGGDIACRSDPGALTALTLEFPPESLRD